MRDKIETDQELILGTGCLGAVSCYSASELDEKLWQWVTTVMGVEANIKFSQDSNSLGILVCPFFYVMWPLSKVEATSGLLL
jgi:hypothetical protein